MSMESRWHYTGWVSSFLASFAQCNIFDIHPRLPSAFFKSFEVSTSKTYSQASEMNQLCAVCLPGELKKKNKQNSTHAQLQSYWFNWSGVGEKYWCFWKLPSWCQCWKPLDEPQKCWNFLLSSHRSSPTLFSISEALVALPLSVCAPDLTIAAILWQLTPC